MTQARRTRLATLVLLAGTAPGFGQPETAPKQVSVTAVRAWPGAGAHRVAIELGGEAKFSYQRLGDPDRIFVDIKDAVLRMSGRGPHVVKTEDGLVSRIRVAQRDARVVRVVLDLAEAPADYQVTQLESPNRIVVEVRSKGEKPAEAPTASAKSEEPVAKPAEIRPAAPKPVELSKSAEKNTAPAGGDATPARTAAPAPKTARARSKAEVAAAKPELAAAKPEAAAARPELAAAKPEAEPAKTDAVPDTAAPPQPAGRLSNGRRDMTRVLGLKLGRVLIDPGHGGHDQGTAGPTGLLEKELVLDVSLRVGQLLREKGVAEVFFTRERDEFIPLESRPAMAGQLRADLFLSIHANSSPLKNISGAETFFLNFTSVKADLEVAARENASTQKSMYELREILQKIALVDKVEESREFASRVQTSLAGMWKKANAGSINRGVKKAPFVVLIGASMPSILAEIGFVSNPKDEALMKTPEFRQTMAESIAEGVVRYAETLSRTQVARKE